MSVDSIDVEDEIYIAYLRDDGVDIGHSVNNTVGYAFCELNGGFLAGLGYHDLYQYATLHYHGGTYFREESNFTAGND